MPKLKDRHGSSKKKKEFSSHADMKPTPDQSKSNEHLDLPASSQGHPLTAAAHTSFVVSANWKNLAKVSKISKREIVLHTLYLNLHVY